MEPTDPTKVEILWSAVTIDIETGGDAVTGYRLYGNTGVDDAPQLIFDGADRPSRPTAFFQKNPSYGLDAGAEVSVFF